MISLKNCNELPSILKRAVKELQNAVTGGGVDVVGITGTSLLRYVCQTVSADGAIPIKTGVAAITKDSAAALTIAAPTTAQDGTVISIVSSTAYAHVVTFTGGNSCERNVSRKDDSDICGIRGSRDSYYCLQRQMVFIRKPERDSIIRRAATSRLLFI